MATSEIFRGFRLKVALLRRDVCVLSVPSWVVRCIFPPKVSITLSPIMIAKRESPTTTLRKKE